MVIVADNSDSLSWSRDSLAAGLKNLLVRVHGEEARFFVLTATQYGASSQAAVSPITGQELVRWHEPVSGAPYSNPMTTYTQQCADGQGTTAKCPTLLIETDFPLDLDDYEAVDSVIVIDKAGAERTEPPGG